MSPATPRPRRRRWLRWVLGGVGVAVVVVVVLVVTVIVRTRGDQELVLPDGPWPTTPTTLVADGRLTLSETAVMQGSTRRAAAVFVPADRRPGERLPAVVVLHGLGASPQLIYEGGAWGPALAERRLVGVFPRAEVGSWNAGGCCRTATTLGIGDDAFLSALIDELGRRDDVDPDRIFLVGDSNGGMMVYRLLCDGTARLAGAASVTGTDVADCELDLTIPLLHVAGTADDVVPYDGGTTAASLAFSDGSFPSVPGSIATLAEAAGCDPDPAREESGPVSVTDWVGCRSGASVRLVTIAGAPHQWPRGEPYDATAGVLDYFGLTPSG